MTTPALDDPDVEAAVAAAAVRSLRGAARFDLDAPFALLGIDSLATIEMASALEDALGCELPPALLLDCPDGRALAARIAEVRASGPVADCADPCDQMLADAMLPDGVRPPQRVPFSPDLRRARRILLTGATGFLGGALLKELLEETSAEIVCLVRKPAFRLCRGWGGQARKPHPGPLHRQRTREIVADLSRPCLGLSQEAFDALATEVDAVLHCGAAVNWVYPYAGLRAANVLGTLELLRLACRRGVPFHFVSSLSVCYSSTAPRTVDELFDPVPHVRGLRLGYAQTKAVAEALVRQAADRGLRVRIYRPALISGESTTGDYNRDDLISALVRGCVHMGTAPDLDWKLDCQPVDVVAKAIVHLSRERRQTFHIGHLRPRHWRECVLWMRMYGYPIRLVPHHAWLRQLDRETAPSAASGASSHPLRPLRAFFLDRHHDARGLTMPELYEEERRTFASSERTAARLRRAGVMSPRLDAALLDTYFAAFRRNGDLTRPAVRPSRRHEPVAPLRFTPELLGRLLGRPVTAIRVLDSGSDHSIIGELTAWRSRQRSGLFHVNVDCEGGPSLDLRLKVKAPDLDVIAVGAAVADLIDPAIGSAYGRWSHRLGFIASHVREIEIYRQADRRFTRHAPALMGSLTDDSTGTWIAALENVTDATLLNGADGGDGWRDADIRVAIDGLAALHAIWYGREDELRAAPWIGYIQTSARMNEMADLWTALAHHAAPAFSSWGDPDIASLQHRLIAGIGQWWPDLETCPRTLIHHDFNPRNVCLRAAAQSATEVSAPRRAQREGMPGAPRVGGPAPRSAGRGELCAYDWELATLGAPQRDLAELLCFVLADDVRGEEVQQWIDHHRAALERETGTSVDRELWQRGFRAGLYDVMVNRLAVYALVHRVRRQPFLPRVVRTWNRIYEHFPLPKRVPIRTVQARLEDGAW